jgi:hypothetical protein
MMPRDRGDDRAVQACETRLSPFNTSASTGAAK